MGDGGMGVLLVFKRQDRGGVGRILLVSNKKRGPGGGEDI